MRSLNNWLKINSKFNILAVLVILLFSILTSSVVYAHGVNIKYNADLTYGIEARFDNGQPIAGGQVTIYSPDNPTEPWGVGITDEEGLYLFTPDNIEGNWTIKIRQAGHGSSVTIPIGGEKAAYSGDTGFSLSQILLMTVCVIWGSVGTALYFKRRKE